MVICNPYGRITPIAKLMDDSIATFVEGIAKSNRVESTWLVPEYLLF